MGNVIPKITAARDENGEPYLEIFGDPDSRVILSLGADGGWSSAIKGEEGGHGDLPEPLRKGLLLAFLRWEIESNRKGKEKE